MAQQQLLDLLGVDLLATTVDQVLDPAVDGDEPTAVDGLDGGEVAGAVEAVGGERARIVFGGVEVAAQGELQTALNSRVIIEQAKGVLAQHFGLSMDGAFERLRSFARAHSLRLADVAHRLVDGDLDPAALVPAAEPAQPAARRRPPGA